MYTYYVSSKQSRNERVIVAVTLKFVLESVGFELKRKLTIGKSTAFPVLNYLGTTS
jgi:hypothetical protein